MARILVIDDRVSQVKAYAKILKHLNHEVLQATNGQTGLEELLKDPDLVLVDFNMPVMDGLEFARHVREDPEYSRYKDIPLIGIGSFPPEAGKYLTKSFEKPVDWEYDLFPLIDECTQKNLKPLAPI